MSNKSDRKFDTWEWSDPSVAPKKLTFEVRMERHNNVAEGPIRYYVKSADPLVHVEAPDLGPLRDKLDTAVRAFYAVAWERVLVVRVEQKPGTEEAGGASVALEIAPIERGMLNGQPVFRKTKPAKADRLASSYEYAIQRGEIPPVFTSYGREEIPQYVLPDTPAVRELLGQESERLASWAADLVRKITDAQIGVGTKEVP
jgi:hypothetical protein